ncbi:MAG: hypothetical protein WDA10_08905 [Porticoccaceae bacterium]|nr:hypothetical protein [Porticoccaceae bacterium]MEA3301163.1 hypothetical protein [Pseudomonadota bacterium]
MTLSTTPFTRRAGIAALFALALLAGCDKQGPAEKTGEAIDDAARGAVEQIEEAGEQIQNCVDKDGQDC